MRFAAILTKAGWTRRKTRIGKSSVWRFYPPKDE
jgi:hypothetical protein